MLFDDLDFVEHILISIGIGLMCLFFYFLFLSAFEVYRAILQQIKKPISELDDDIKVLAYIEGESEPRGPCRALELKEEKVFGYLIIDNYENDNNH